MRLAWGHICDHAFQVVTGVSPKVGLVGIFNIFKLIDEGSVLPRFYFCAEIAGSVGDLKPTHDIRLRILDGDAGEVLEQNIPNISFLQPEPGNEWGHYILQEVNNLSLIPGEYTIEIAVDGVRLGEVPFKVIEHG